MKWKRGERLTEPLVRDGSGLRPAGWDEALDRAARGFQRVAREQGAAGLRDVQLFQDDQ